MPVTVFQKGLAKLLSVNRSVDSHLAGGAALHFEPQSIRYSNDLDYFHDTEERVATAFAADQELLIKNKYEVKVEIHQSGYIRAIVSKKNDSTKIDWAHDSAWRFMPVQFSEDRDYLDVHDIHGRILNLGFLCWAACGKDPGFTPKSLLALLKRRGKYHDEDFKRLKLNIKIDLVELKSKWLQMLDEAEKVINQLPVDHAGCLYYSQKDKKFVNTFAGSIAHFGKMGGVLPQIVS